MSVLYQPSISTEYVLIPTIAQEDGEEIDPTTIAVQLAFINPEDEPEEDDWQDATWETKTPAQTINGTSYTYYARLLIGPDGGYALEPGIYTPWIRLPDSPETIVRPSGTLVITGSSSYSS